ncbi:hypothetical protein T265_00875 [Opisthorchis viverrini]|uniref:Uncharacterized protein n=1 Tax=Opisthorchis viverrini TaxID=6198 RepID=A0A075A4K0_OPIVI|nr:hypothetical protein T265_00875 [Opisthorchis viverrini]KER33177.1 hypothetical protein T265_00875 [Opisthorchis viverrini]
MTKQERHEFEGSTAVSPATIIRHQTRQLWRPHGWNLRGKSRGIGRIRTTDLAVSKFALQPLGSSSPHIQGLNCHIGMTEESLSKQWKEKTRDLVPTPLGSLKLSTSRRHVEIYVIRINAFGADLSSGSVFHMPNFEHNTPTSSTTDYDGSVICYVCREGLARMHSPEGPWFEPDHWLSTSPVWAWEIWQYPSPRASLWWHGS